MPAQEVEAVAARPDWALLTKDRMPDRGPRYTETPADPYAPDAPFIAEPWNAVTASLFIWIGLVWPWRLCGRFKNYPFLVCCMPIFLVGGIGGTLYHAFRTKEMFFYLDVIPIFVLGVAGGVFMAIRVWGRIGWWYIIGGMVAYLGFSGFFFIVIAPLPWVATLTRDPRALGINATYAALAVVVLTPLVWSLFKTRFRYGGWVVAAIVSFVFALIFRLFDRDPDMVAHLPMGTHWLWHTFGAITTLLMVEYFYLVEGEGEKQPPMNADERQDQSKEVSI
jgi:hypothetical protein